MSKSNVFPIVQVCFAMVAAMAICVHGPSMSALAADDDDASAIEYPMLFFSFASVDRMVERGSSLLKAAGKNSSARHSQTLISELFGKADLISKVKGMNHSKPFGILVFYGFATMPLNDESNANPVIKNADASDSAEDGESEFVKKTFDAIDFAFAGDNLPRMIAVLPINRLDDLRDSFGLSADATKPNGFRNRRQGFFAEQSGDYLLIATESGLLTACAEPRATIDSGLGQSDAAFSFHVKGIPVGMRMLGVSMAKSEFVDSLKRRDDEPKFEHQLRKAFGTVTAEWIDVALTQVDEVKVTMRLDPHTCELTTDIELIGAENGQLAGLVQEYCPRSSRFEHLWNPDAACSYLLSFVIPERHAKTLSKAINDYVSARSDQNSSDACGLLPVIVQGLQATRNEQFDLLYTTAMNGESGSPLMVLNMPDQSTALPRNVSQIDLLRSSNVFRSFELVDHAKKPAETSIYKVSVASSTAQSWIEYWSRFNINLNESLGKEVFVTATSDAIWIAGQNTSTQSGVPQAIQSVLDESLLKQTNHRRPNGQSFVPFRLSLHSRDWSFDPVVTESSEHQKDANGAQQPENSATVDEENAFVQALFRDHPDGVHVFIRSMSTGLKISVTVEEAFLGWTGYRLSTNISTKGSNTNGCDPKDQ